MAKKKGISSKINRGGDKKKSSGVSSSIRSDSKRPRPASRPKPRVTTSSSSDKKTRVPASSARQKPSMTSMQKPAIKDGISSASTAVSEHASRMASLRARWEGAAALAGLAILYDHLEDVTNTVNGLDHHVGDLRARGYVFGRDWEAQAAAFQGQWPSQYDDAARLLEDEQRALRRTSQDAEGLLDRASRTPSMVGAAEDRVNALERHIDDAKRRVEGLFDETSSDVVAFERDLAHVASVMDDFESAAFKLYPEEHPFEAAKAIWAPKGAEEIEGLLFLTDGRLLFEQREEVATKKFLFVTTEKKEIQELLWQAPVGAVEIISTEDKKAFMSHKELLTLRLEEGDAPPEVTLTLKGTTNEDWARLIRRAKEGQLEAERYDLALQADADATAETAEATAEAEPSELPTRCPSCNAPLPTIYKGMQQVTCDYCGMVIRLDQ